MGHLEAVLAKVRERELDRYAAAYAVAAWILIQAASIALPAYDMPSWLLRWLIAAAILGFPVVLFTVWVLKKPAQEKAPPSRRRDIAVLAVLAVVSALTLGELAWHLSKSTPASAPPAVAPSANASIAVLPFANTSSEPGQKFFGEGIAEELIGVLARNPQLRVAARTSSFAFEGQNLDARTIAQKLNVRTVLEGSVRTAEGRVRIEVDLINASNGYQIWARSYERPLQDILALQSDIAQSIASSLTPELAGAPLRKTLPKAISIDPNIYRTYLEAQFALDKRGAAIPEAVAKFRQVTNAVPDFADAQAGLAYALTIQAAVEQKPSPEAEKALATALRLDPANAVALTVSIDRALARSDWNTVIDDANRLRAAGSRSGVALHGLANAYGALGFYEQSIAVSREVENLDPMTDVALTDVAFGEFLGAHYAVALADTETLIARNPDDFFFRNLKCNIAASLKKFDIADGSLAIMRTNPADGASVLECKIFIAINSGRTQEARDLINDFAMQPDQAESEVAWLLAKSEQYDRAVDWFVRAADKNNLEFELLLSAQIPEALHASARWKAFFERPDMAAWLRARERAGQMWNFPKADSP
jgi:TolB-like protein